MCRVLASQRKVYRMVGDDELERVSGTVHHGQVVAIIDEPRWEGVTSQALGRWARAGEGVLVLDRVGNPHNLGAIVRSAAFFGVRHLVLEAGPEQARPSGAAWRTARGGMSHVEIVVAEQGLVRLCQSLRRAGYVVLATSVRDAEPIELSQPPRGKPVALVLGNEEHGLERAVLEAADRRVLIPGSGAVESLNVSAAAAVLLAWLAPGRRSAPG